MKTVREFYNRKIIVSGDRLEMFIYSGQGIELNRFDEQAKRGEEKKQQHLEESKNKLKSRKCNLNNAKNKIRRLIDCNQDMSTFLTLTFADDIAFSESKRKLNIFFKLLKRKHESLKYIWVLELTKRGRPHYHCLINYPVPCETTTRKGQKKSQEQMDFENWFNEKFWRNGFVTIQKVRSGAEGKLSNYLTKYLTKDLINLELEELENQKVYNYSRNLNRPIIDRYSSNKSIEEEIKDKKDYYIRFVNSYPIGNENVTYIHFEKIK